MTSDEVAEDLLTGESYTVEFKAEINDDKLVESLVCLANGDGGRLYIGVGDDGAVVGASARHGEVTDPHRVAALIANKTSPSLVTTVEVVTLSEGPVIVIDVPKATHGLVATTSGLYLRRAIDVAGRPQCLPMQPHEAMARLSSLGVRDLSALPIDDLDEADLDSDELRRFRDLARAGGDHVLGELSDRDLLTALGFTDIDGRMTLGAVLMFGTRTALQHFAPTHETAFQVVDADETVRVNRIERLPLLRSMLDLVDAVKPYNPEEELETGLFRIGLPAFAEVGVRELVANALVHRDHGAIGQVRLLIEDRTLSISNPGGFPEGITVNNLLTAPPQARNPRLADAFKRAGLVERTGRGVNRVFRGQLELGRPAPDYSRSTHRWVEARLRAGPADRELAAYIAQARRDGRTLDLFTLQVLHEVRSERRITSARAAELLQVSTDEARAVLNDLVERGYLEARGERKGRTYHLTAAMYRQLGGSAGYVRTRGFDRIQQEQMIVTYVKEHGSINRSEAAELCQLAPEQASRLLKRMADDGTLTMTGERRAARYRVADQHR